MKIVDIDKVIGLPDVEKSMLGELIKEYESHEKANSEKERYYNGKITLEEVNLGIALPEGLKKLEIGCAWGAKAVDVLAGRSMFDGFVGEKGENNKEIDQITRDNDLIAEYQKACRDELKLGASFATLSADKKKKCRIRFHSANTSAAVWDGTEGRIAYGMTIMELESVEKKEYTAKTVRLDTDTDVWEIEKGPGGAWTATQKPHKMGRPLMEPLIYNPTSTKPFGQSRIKEPVRRLIQGYVRTIANATIGLEFATSPQKYLLGVTDEQYDKIVNQKFRQYVGSILAGTTNPETGNPPVFGQLPQGNISPHVEMLKMLSTQFGAATGLTVTDVGVVNDANPTSSDAILAQSQTLVAMAEQLNARNGDALKNIAVMALAIAQDKKIEDLPDEQKKLIAHFKNPAMPSVAVTADAAIKIASAREGFAETDTFLEMIGFDQADIRRIKGQEARARGIAVLEELES